MARGKSKARSGARKQRQGQQPQAAQPRPAHGGPRKFDFRRPTKFSVDQLRRVEQVHEVFIHTASTQLSMLTREPVDLVLRQVRQETFEAAVTQPQGRLFVAGILTIKPLETQALLRADGDLLLRMMEAVIGGFSDSTSYDGELTDIEQMLAERVMSVICDAFNGAWEELAQLRFELGSVETELSTISFSAYTEPTLALEFELSFHEMSSELSLWVPWASISTVAEAFASPDETAVLQDPQAPQRLRRHLAELPVLVRAEVAKRTMPLAEVLSLRPGDVIAFQAPADQGMVLYTENQPTHRVVGGTFEQYQAVQLIQDLTGGEQ